MINIAYIIDDLMLGGAERTLALTLKKLDKSKYRPRVYALFAGGPIADEIQKMQIPVYVLRLTKFNAILIFIKLAKMLLNDRIQIVHTFRLISDIFGAWAARMVRIPIIISSKASIPWYKKYIHHIADRISMHQVTKIISVSDNIKHHYIKQLAIRPDRIKTIYNAIEHTKFNHKFNPEQRQSELGIKTDDFVIGTIANLNWRKDLFTLLEAAKLVLPEFPQAKFLLIGDGPQKTELQARAQQLGIASQILFLGSRRDIPDLLSLCRLFVLSSVTEGLAVAILEAMAMGKPVIATNVGGIPEVVISNETGLLVPPKSPDLMAQAIKKLIKHEELAAHFGAAGKRRVEQYFSDSKMINSLESLYDELLNKQ